MKNQLKPLIWVRKKRPLKNPKYYRYFSVTDPLNLDNNIRISKKTGRQYQNVVLHTEKQLVTFIRDNFGYGEYEVFASVKRRRGIWKFWQGSIEKDGWLFYVKEYDKSEVEKISYDMINADDDDSEFLTEMRDDEKRFAKEESKKKRYGFQPFLRSSGRRGDSHGWDEDDEGLVAKPVSKPSTPTGEPVSIDDINNF